MNEPVARCSGAEQLSGFGEGRRIVDRGRSQRPARCAWPCRPAPCPGRIRRRPRRRAPSRACTVSTQRTGPAAWRTRASRIRSGSVSTATSMLLTTGIRGAASATEASRSRSASAAGFIRLEWKGADTGSGSARLAPLAFSTSQALSTAALLPAITVCIGSLKLTASTTSALPGPNAAVTSAQPAFTLAASMPRMAAIAPTPTGTACCIAWARKRTSGAACASVRTPEATRAEYSPSEWPATTDGSAPPSAQPGAPGGDAGDQHHGLGVGGQGQGFLGAFVDQAGDVFIERIGGFAQRFERLPGDRPRRRACRPPASPDPERRMRRTSLILCLLRRRCPARAAHRT